MKRAILLIAVLCLVGVVSSPGVRAAEITAAHVAGKPDVYLKVEQEPDPLLLGHWGCTHVTKYPKTGETFKEPIEFWLLKVDGKYAIYFNRYKSRLDKTYRGWREWSLKGDRVVSPPDIEISVQDGAVYYQWKNDPPTKMTRIGP